MKITPLAFGLALIACATTVLSAATPKHVTYTIAQAAQGRTLYNGNCALCHGANMQGISGPALKGSDSNVQLQTVQAIYTYTTGQMPMGNAGGLAKGDYVKLLAFILQSNGVPAGSKPASTSSLAKTEIDIGKLR